MGRKSESASSSKNLTNREIVVTIARAGFESLSPELIRVEITDAFRRRLGECRPIPSADRSATATYEIRIASRLFETETDEQWRDTVRHEVAHAHVFETVGHDAQPHGDAWKAAARRAGADPTARYEGDGLVDGDYILACPQGCFERVYLKRSKRVKTPWLYTCVECDSSPISYDVADRPPEPEPGRCYVQSIPWQSQTDRNGSKEPTG